MGINRFYLITLMIFILILGYLNYQVWRPFLTPILWAIVLSILFYPFYSFILRFIHIRSISSAIALFIILILILGPFSYITFILITEIKEWSEHLTIGKLDMFENFLQKPAFGEIIGKITSILNISVDDFEKAIISQISQIGRKLLEEMTKGIFEIITITFNFIIMAISIFFFLKDGPSIFNRVRDHLPFSEKQRENLLNRIKDLIISTIYGGVIVAIAQGSIGGIAFAIVGISSPVFWGTVMAFASFLPIFGSFIIWGPATFYLFIKGEILKGITLGTIGALGISLIDNFLRPLIIGNRTKLPFLAIFFSVFGGIKLFGILGVIMGPMVLVLFLSLVEILRNLEESS